MLSIRTQDRMALVPYDSEIEIKYSLNEKGSEKLNDTKTTTEYITNRIILIQFEENVEYYLVSNKTKLGTYKTKERALEVLDEIEEVILSANMWVNDGIAVDKVPPQNRIHQMPKE